jgi:hypothetical protein
MQLTDTLGLTDTTSTLIYQIGGVTEYLGTVQWIPYTKLDPGAATGNYEGKWNTVDSNANWTNSPPANSTSQTEETQILGQIANFTDQPVYVYFGNQLVSPATNSGPTTCEWNFGNINNQAGGPMTFLDGTDAFTDGDGNSCAVYGFQDTYASGSNPVGPFNDLYPQNANVIEGVRIGALLQPFTQSAGNASSTIDVLSAAGVRPGMKNTAGGTLGNYDFTGGCVVNFGIKMNRSLALTASTQIYLGQGTNSAGNVLSTSYTSLTVGQGFYINEQTGDADTYPTSTSDAQAGTGPASTQNTGPTEPI